MRMETNEVFRAKQIHPVHFEVLRADMSIENTKKLVEYISSSNGNICIRSKREKGMSVIMSSKISNTDIKYFVWKRFDAIQADFKMKSCSLDIDDDLIKVIKAKDPDPIKRRRRG